jgi:hypothetical protein
MYAYSYPACTRTGAQVRGNIALRILTIRQMKVAMLSALRSFTSREDPCYSFLLEYEWTPPEVETAIWLQMFEW